MKRFLILLLCFTFSGALLAQTEQFHPLAEAQQATLLRELSTAVQSLQCDFVQEKTSTMLADVSRFKGQLSFQSPHQLRWEYFSPNPMVFIYADGKALTLDAQGRPLKQNNRMIQEMSKLILGLVSGDALQNQTQFKVSCYESKGQYKIHLQPLNSRLKSMMQDIVLLLNRQTKVATSIQLNELGGDQTVIKFSKPQINQPLNHTLFKIN